MARLFKESSFGVSPEDPHDNPAANPEANGGEIQTIAQLDVNRYNEPGVDG